MYGQVATTRKAAEKTLVEAFWAADASRARRGSRRRGDRARVRRSATRRAQFDEAERWSGTAEAVLQRLGGHELLRAWQLNNIGAVRGLRGDREARAAAQQQALALKEKALGRDHPDVGVSEGNISVELAGLARNQEALAHVDRAVALIENGLGAGHPDLATQLNNRGEILNALGRQREARAVVRARAGRSGSASSASTIATSPTR